MGEGSFIGSGSIIREGLTLPPKTIISAGKNNGMAKKNINLMDKLKKVTVIAEAGVNHNGDLNIAFDLIKVAANAGADIIKFQTFQAEEVATSYSKRLIIKYKIILKKQMRLKKKCLGNLNKIMIINY